MNGFLIAAGIVSTFILLGHNTAGRKLFYLPMLEAGFDPLAKRVMSFVWHYISVHLVVSAATLLYLGWGADVGSDARELIVGSLVVQFGAIALVHVILTVTSGIPGAGKKMFQSVFFGTVAVLSGIGMTV